MRYALLLMLALSSRSALAQDLGAERQGKLELIARFQDTRTIFDGKLISFLTDPDSAVRERAVMAFGSIQDSGVISLLVDRFTFDGDPHVRSSAAFAIGQTAQALGRAARSKLEQDIIWDRLDRTSEAARERMIEEIGKFGSETGLNDLLVRFGNITPPVHPQALTMAIARFAIRGITSEDAVRYLLKFIKPPEAATWQMAYALMRVGDHPQIRAELESVALLTRHRDATVRMQIATLLGKVRDTTVCLEPLQRLADSDPDWRVRVNALKALANYSILSHPELIQTFRRLFFSDHMGIALTAISSFGTTGLRAGSGGDALREACSALERIAANPGEAYLWQLQAEAARAVARLEGRNALSLIQPGKASREILRSQLIGALGYTGSPEVVPALLNYAAGDRPALALAALEALIEIARKNGSDSALREDVYGACLSALKNGDVSVTTTAAGILGDTLLRRAESVGPLMDALPDLEIPDGIEAMQEIASTLGKLRDPRAIAPLKRLLEIRDRSVGQAAASALRLIMGRDYRAEALPYFEPVFTDFDFAYLRSLPDTVRVRLETIRGDIALELYKRYAPFTVMSFLKLASQRGFYRGLPFHRVVPNFVIQGGDPRGDGWGGPGYSIRSEFSPLTFETGSLGIASSGKDTEGSQFFITQSPQPHLDGRYTLFGKVIAGMDVVNRIQLDDHIFDVKILP